MKGEPLYVEAWESKAILIETARRLDTTPSELGRSIGVSPRTVHAICSGRWKFIAWQTAEKIGTLKTLVSA